MSSTRTLIAWLISYFLTIMPLPNMPPASLARGWNQMEIMKKSKNNCKIKCTRPRKYTEFQLKPFGSSFFKWDSRNHFLQGQAKGLLANARRHCEENWGQFIWKEARPGTKTTCFCAKSRMILQKKKSQLSWYFFYSKWQNTTLASLEAIWI